MQIRYAADQVRYLSMNSEDLRQSFMVEGLFQPGMISMIYSDADRAIIGSAVPANDALELATADELRAAFFMERREMGVLNIGGSGRVEVDGQAYAMGTLDCLYISRGSRSIRFHNESEGARAEFYLLSYPAHTMHPTTKLSKSAASAVQLGTQGDCNRRTIYKYIHQGGIRSCQLVMGCTELEPGSVWNTMPPHTHARRSEVYLYFNVAPQARVFHLMGLPHETRHLVLADKQAVISPSWSIHSGAGTSNYSFCWGMGGENQAFDDMDQLTVGELK